MSDIKSTRRLQIFISLESAAALNELVEYNHETITRAVEQSLIERQARLPHHAAEDMPGAHGIFPERSILSRGGRVAEPPLTSFNGPAKVVGKPLPPSRACEIKPEAGTDVEMLDELSSFNDPTREKRKQARKEWKAALAGETAGYLDSIRKQGEESRESKPESVADTPRLSVKPRGISSTTVACPHPSGNRTSGKNWKCNLCGYQHASG